MIFIKDVCGVVVRAFICRSEVVGLYPSVLHISLLYCVFLSPELHYAGDALAHSVRLMLQFLPIEGYEAKIRRLCWVLLRNVKRGHCS